MSQSSVKDWSTWLSCQRIGVHNDLPAPPARDDQDQRTASERDFDRILFSTPFRRLLGKTQVVVRPDDDHTHNRLIHSMETATIGRSLGFGIGQLVGADPRTLGSVVAAACLMHDLGNPPFGHAGEEAIGDWFRGFFQDHPDLADQLTNAQRQDLEQFEGNAQGFRIATRLTMYREKGGLRLSAAVLAATLKYPQSVEQAGKPGQWKKHGFHQADAHTYQQVIAACGLSPGQRHPATWLVEAADDICYQILDLEDAWRLGQISLTELKGVLAPLVQGKTSELQDESEQVGELRARAIRALCQSATTTFVNHQSDFYKGLPGQALLQRTPFADDLKAIREFSWQRLYQHPEKVRAEAAGMRILAHYLDVLVPMVIAQQRDGLTERTLAIFGLTNVSGPLYQRLLMITDVLAGMTDRYAQRMVPH